MAIEKICLLLKYRRRRYLFGYISSGKQIHNPANCYSIGKYVEVTGNYDVFNFKIYGF